MVRRLTSPRLEFEAAAIYEYPEHLRSFLNDLPTRPGVYLFHGESDTMPLYIGKSINIRSRVLSHLRTPDKCNKATLFRALEENAAIVSACNLQQIADFSNIHPSSLVFAGGGSKGKLWSQILADVSGLPVNIPVVKEATALGCAIAAGVGAGIFSSMAETGERLVRWERTHTPDPEKHELYQDSRDKWQAVYQDQLGLVDHGLTTSLWKAPGL